MQTLGCLQSQVPNQPAAATHPSYRTAACRFARLGKRSGRRRRWHLLRLGRRAAEQCAHAAGWVAMTHVQSPRESWCSHVSLLLTPQHTAPLTPQHTARAPVAWCQRHLFRDICRQLQGEVLLQGCHVGQQAMQLLQVAERGTRLLWHTTPCSFASQRTPCMAPSSPRSCSLRAAQQAPSARWLPPGSRWPRTPASIRTVASSAMRCWHAAYNSADRIQLQQSEHARPCLQQTYIKQQNISSPRSPSPPPSRWPAAPATS